MHNRCIPVFEMHELRKNNNFKHCDYIVYTDSRGIILSVLIMYKKFIFYSINVLSSLAFKVPLLCLNISEFTTVIIDENDLEF